MSLPYLLGWGEVAIIWHSFMHGGEYILKEKSNCWDFLNLKRYTNVFIQENYNTPLEHTPTNPPGQLWKESHYSLLVKVWGCVPKVCWNNLRVYLVVGLFFPDQWWHVMPPKVVECWASKKLTLRKRCDEQKLTNWINQTKHYIYILNNYTSQQVKDYKY